MPSELPSDCAKQPEAAATAKSAIAILCTWAFIFIFVFPLSSSLPAKVPESRMSILVLSWFTESDYRSHLRSLSERLRRYGLREGTDYQFRFAQTRTQAEADAAIAAQGARPFVIYTTNTSPASFVIESRTAAPHVFSTYSDPLADGWIASYQRPGGNSTGVVELAQVHEKRLDVLARAVPRARRIAIVLETSGNGERVPEAAARFLRNRPDVSIEYVWVTKDDSAEAISRRLRDARAQAVYVPLGGEMIVMADTVFQAIRNLRLPAAGERVSDVRRGAIVALEVDRAAHVDRIASQLALILQGASPAEVPVHSPRRVALIVNLDAARALGLDVSRALLRQADFVVADGKY